VYLWGTVHTDHEKTRADSLAAQVKGVKKVINQLHAPVAWNWKSDWEIREALHQEFWWSPFLQKESIHVQVEHGVATLTGRVNSWRQRQIAQDKAYEGGARFVDNQLRVRSLQ
jgi:osmotically-inducible protein OsmY